MCYKFFTHVQRVQIKWNINGLKFVFYFFLFMHFAVQRVIYLVHQKQGISQLLFLSWFCSKAFLVGKKSRLLLTLSFTFLVTT